MQGAFDQFRLPPGRHGLPDSHVRENQRWRLLGACAEIISARGYGGLSLRALTKEAAVSKDTFYKHFKSLDECIVETYAMVAESLLVAAGRGCEGAPSGSAKMNLGVETIARLFGEEPALAYVLADLALLDLPGVYSEQAKLVDRLATSLAAVSHGDAGAGGKLDRSLRLHRVRAALGCLSLWLIEQSPAAVADAAPQLSLLLQG
jgi:AcrR family transcriptional regulator